MPQLSVIIPVLNESENIPLLANRLLLPVDGLEFIFVDDGSTDGSREIIEKLEIKDDRITGIFNARRMGHMGSYLIGIEHASSENIAIMDGDLQHPPEKLTSISEMLVNGYDIVICSRYKGKKFIGDRDKIRGIISRGAELLLKVMVKECRGISDPISGFIGFKKSLEIPVTQNMRGNKLLPFLIIANRDAKIGYVHYNFSERTAGTSKIVSTGNNFVLKYISEVSEIRKVKKRLLNKIRIDPSNEH